MVCCIHNQLLVISMLVINPLGQRPHGLNPLNGNAKPLVITTIYDANSNNDVAINLDWCNLQHESGSQDVNHTSRHLHSPCLRDVWRGGVTDLVPPTGTGALHLLSSHRPLWVHQGTLLLSMFAQWIFCKNVFYALKCIKMSSLSQV